MNKDAFARVAEERCPPEDREAGDEQEGGYKVEIYYFWWTPIFYCREKKHKNKIRLDSVHDPSDCLADGRIGFFPCS